MSALSAEALGALAGLGSALTWALTSLLVGTLVPRFHTVAINAIRSSLSGVLLLAVIVLTGGASALTSISPSTFMLLVISIVAAIGVGDTVFFDSTRRLGLGRGMSIAMTYPVVASLLAITFMDERITLPVALGSLLTLAGLLLIVGSRRRDEVSAGMAWRIGVAGAVVAAIAWGVSAVLMKAPLREVDAVTAQAVRLPIAGAMLFALPWARGAVGQLRASEPTVVWRIAGLSVLTAFSSVMYVASLKYAGVTVATVLSSTAPLFAIPLGLFWLGERLSVGPVIGALVTVAGIAILQA